jgi:hypothetical protein
VLAHECFARWWPDEAKKESPWLDQLQLATKAEFGETLVDIIDFCWHANHLFGEVDHAVGRVAQDRFVREISDALGWPAERVHGILDRLALGPRASFLCPPAPFKARDVFPWLFNRPLSHLRRPFILRATANGPGVVWGRRQLGRSCEFMTAICTNGRLVPHTRDMKQFISDHQAEESRAFNAAVAELLGADPTAVVRVQVNKIGKARIAGPSGDLGDIDVLAALPRRGELLLLECKRLARARTPYEISAELRKLLVDEGGDSSFVRKHQRRVEWIRRHLDEVLAWLRLEKGASWQLRPLIVVEHESMAAFLRSSEIPICTLRELQARLGSSTT